MAITIRTAGEGDIAAMAAIRAREWESEEYWNARIAAYLSGEHSPTKGLAGRAVFVAEEDGVVVGFVAGHLTKRFDCNAELQWIDVIAEKRGQGIGRRLIEKIAAWFVEQNARRVCVDPDGPARTLYKRFGATALNRHWMVWEDSREMLRRTRKGNEAQT
jgi:GNAT superfamily N-acetyltransferase